MARGVRIRFKKQGFPAIMAGPEAQEMLDRRARAITAACNNDSTWGGYHYAVSRDAVRARARIWSADARNDEARDQRLIRNLDAGGGA
jgi:hypothetical protein